MEFDRELAAELSKEVGFNIVAPLDLGTEELNNKSSRIIDSFLKFAQVCLDEGVELAMFEDEVAPGINCGIIGAQAEGRWLMMIPVPDVEADMKEAQASTNH